MKLLITGGAGYIGSVVTDLALQNNHQVRAIDILWFDKKVPLRHLNNQNYEFLKGDIADNAFVKKSLDKIDFVIHAAAVVGEPASKRYPELTYKINYEATVNLIEMIKESDIKGIIFLSTCSNYGISEGLANEESPLKPLSLYAQTKVNIERYLMDQTKKTDWVICRLSTVYGSSPRMRFDLTVNDFAMNAFIKKYLKVFLPYSYRPYIHVNDVANVLLRIINNFPRVKNTIFNIGFNGENYQKIKIVEVIKKFIPDLEIEIIKRGVDLRDYRVDFSKLEKYLGVSNSHTVEDGVKEVIELLNLGLFENLEDEKYYNTSPKLGDIN